ncbi:MAG: ribonuclease E/G, partial [Pseudonocardiaceae bacterium]
MVLESNRDLVLRRLTECLGRDRTRHQVAEVTSLGLVQMTRKKVGTGLLEAYSTTCENCKGRGVLVSTEPVNVRSQGVSVPTGPLPKAKDSGGVNGRRSRSRGRGSPDGEIAPPPPAADSADSADSAEPRSEPMSETTSGGTANSTPATAPPATDAPGAPAQQVARTVTRRRRAASRPAGPPAPDLPEGVDSAVPVLRGDARELSTPV